MKKTIFSLFLLITITSLFVEAQTIKKLDPQNFEKQLKESKDPILVDVRTPGEYAQGHLANAVLIDIYSDDFKSRVGKLDKSKPVFVYCKAGSRSGSAVGVFTEMGFKEIYDLSGGITAWQRASKPIEKR
ncbi:MAG TPA: rhodanese-like domain-containing protein [Cyclobacteriaceae bacterium]|nr:rhodanese-like domain-containing protein [Cyclobacteriaceae bacterium]